MWQLVTVTRKEDNIWNKKTSTLSIDLLTLASTVFLDSDDVVHTDFSPEADVFWQN